jgi:hypothetical protein
LDFELCTQVWAWLLQTLPLAATGDRRVFIYTLRKEKMSRRELTTHWAVWGSSSISWPIFFLFLQSMSRQTETGDIKGRSLFIVIFSLLFFFFIFIFSRSNYLAMWKKTSGTPRVSYYLWH